MQKITLSIKMLKASIIYIFIFGSVEWVDLILKVSIYTYFGVIHYSFIFYELLCVMNWEK